MVPKLAKIRWDLINNKILYILMLSIIALLTDTTWNYLEYRDLKKKEEESLNDKFPPLSQEQVRKYLSQLFPSFTKAKKEVYGKHIKYLLYDGSRLIGSAYQIREDLQCPVCEDVRFFLGVRQNNNISGIILVNPFELYGERLPLEIQDNFLSQFLNRNLKDSFILVQDIDAISGATKTTIHFLEGILDIKSIHLKKEIKWWQKL